MATAEILQEYLVKLGFQTDSSSFHRFEDNLSGITKKIFSTGKALAGMTMTLAATAEAFAVNMRDMYFETKMIGSSVAGLEAMEYAGKRVGISSDAMASAVHNLGMSLRLTPGMREYVNGLLGVNEAGKQTQDVMADLVNYTKKFPEYIGANMMSQFGMDNETYLKWRDRTDEMKKSYADMSETFKEHGYGTDEQAKKFVDLANAVTKVETELKATTAQALEPMIPTLTKVVDAVADLDKAIGLLNVTLGVFAAQGALRLLAPLLGGGAAGAAGGSAAGAVLRSAASRVLPFARGATGIGMMLYSKDLNVGEDEWAASLRKQYANTHAPSQFTRILNTIKSRESGNYQQAPTGKSSASGAYQFTKGTWQRLTRKYGYGKEYSEAYKAPSAIQDVIAANYVSDLMKQANGDVSKIPLAWYTGNLQGKMTPEQLSANRGLTAEVYQQRWMATYNGAIPSQKSSSMTQTNNITINSNGNPQEIAQAVTSSINKFTYPTVGRNMVQRGM